MIVKGYKIEPGANLAGADLTDAFLFCANLTDANLTSAKWGITTKVTRAIMPDGSIHD